MVVAVEDDPHQVKVVWTGPGLGRFNKSRLTNHLVFEFGVFGEDTDNNLVA